MDSTAPQPPKFYSPLAAILITVGIYLLAQLLGGVIIFIIPSLLHRSLNSTSSLLSNNAWAQFILIATVETITMLLVYKFLKSRKISWSDIGFNKPKLMHGLLAILGFVAYFVMYIIVLIVVSKFIPGLNLEQKQELGFNNTARGHDLWFIFASLVILPPLVEEIVMRGFLFTNLRIKLSFLKSAVIVSILFAAAHLGEGGSGGLLWVAAIDTFVLSLVLCYLREKTKSLWPSIGVHLIKNGLAFILLFNILSKIKFPV